jgi:uncharacterized protein (TIGR02453 family)
MAPRFTPQSLTFLRSLARNNRREWFAPRKATYEELLKAPMTALVERLAREFRSFAPDLVASPRASMYRIYRDTRFSTDKSPLKTHIAAVFPHRLLPKHEGAGLYIEVAARHVWLGGGMYMPSTAQLHQVREHIASHYRRLDRIVSGKPFRLAVGELGGDTLQRMPRGFPADHPAAEYLKHRQFLAGAERPADFAVSATFERDVVRIFKAIAPLIAFLNEPLIAGLTRATASSATWPGLDA